MNNCTKHPRSSDRPRHFFIETTMALGLFPLLSPAAAALWTLSKACQPWSLPWLSILTSCLQSGWALWAQCFSPSGSECAEVGVMEMLSSRVHLSCWLLCARGLQSQTKRRTFGRLDSSARRCDYPVEGGEKMPWPRTGLTEMMIWKLVHWISAFSTDATKRNRVKWMEGANQEQKATPHTVFS